MNVNLLPATVTAAEACAVTLAPSTGLKCESENLTGTFWGGPVWMTICAVISLA